MIWKAGYEMAEMWGAGQLNCKRMPLIEFFHDLKFEAYTFFLSWPMTAVRFRYFLMTGGHRFTNITGYTASDYANDVFSIAHRKYNMSFWHRSAGKKNYALESSRTPERQTATLKTCRSNPSVKFHYQKPG